MTSYPTVKGGDVFPDREYVLEHNADPNFFRACSAYRYSN